MQRRSLLVQLSALPALIAAGATLALPGTARAQTGAAFARIWREGDPGERLNLRGRIVDAVGAPVAGARVHLRQADGTGVYTEQYQASVTTGADGGYGVATVLPGQYAGNKHIHMTVEHDDYAPVTTTIVFKGDNDDPDGVALEQSRMNGELVWQGRYDVRLEN